MSAPAYSVETRGQAALILGQEPSLIDGLIFELKNLGLHAEHFTSPEDLDRLHQTHDLDFLFVFVDSRFLSWSEGEGRELMGALQSLINSGETRLILARHYLFTQFNFPLSPVYKQLIFSDYLGAKHVCSPIVESWLDSISTSQSLVIPGDGLAETSLLSETDLVRALALATLVPSSTLGEELALGNPELISLLNLAYEIRSEVPFKVSLTFNPDAKPPKPSGDSSIFAASCTTLGWRSSTDLPSLLHAYLKQHPILSSRAEPGAVERSDQKRFLDVARNDDLSVGEDYPAPTKPAPSVQNLMPASVLNFVAPRARRLSPLRPPAPVFVPLAPPRPSRPSRTPTKTSYHFGGVVGKGIIVAIALYLGSLAFAATICFLSLRSIYQTLKSGNLPTTNNLNSATTTYLEANLVALGSIPGLNHNTALQSLMRLLDAYSQSLAVFTTAASLDQSAGDIIHYVFGSGSADIAKTISLSRLQTEELSQELSLLAGSLPSDTPSVIPGRYTAAYQSGKAAISRLQHSVSMTRSLLSTAPDLIGLGGRKKYGVLFQNNMELRPTGGFIGSFAVLSFENGKLYDMPVYDVYAADGQLKGHVEPPKPIKDILGEANWYLRDSNFDPDFPTSARRSEWFIKKTLNLDLDGTVGIDVNTLSTLLTAAGPLTIPDYNETITADNLYERTQFHAEVNFFPGSTQKKEFLSSVGDALFAKLPTLAGGQGLKLAAALGDSIDSKDTLISLVSPSSERVFSTLNWNGQISDLPCPVPTNCQKDYLMVVDSNFGVNKANYFMKRQIEEVITLNKNFSADHRLRLHYTNTSTSSSWPAGAYKNYSRLYLPEGAVFNSLKISDQIIDPKNYTITMEHNKTVVGFLLNVPIASSLDVAADYQTAQSVSLDNPTYTWYWQKQPGTDSTDPLTVYINYPMFLNPQVISPQADLTTQQLKFSLKNDTDHRTTVKFAQ
jgi:hypothetical protein